MEFGSVCSGIEAASVAWHPLGWRAVWFAEIDKAASQVLAHRFPDTPNHGDMTLLAGMVERREIPAPDALVGGTPCQAFSVAGLRGGLQDERGQLTLAYFHLANAIDKVRAEDGKPPVIIVWENVPGVLNHKDNPFGCFLAGLAGETDVLLPAGRRWTNAGAVLGPQRAVAWRTLDAQFFGLAQRRRRVFVVASARPDFDPAAILLEFEGVRRDSAPSRGAGEGITHPTAPCLVSSGRGVERTGDIRGQDPVVAVYGRDRQPDVICMAHGQGGAEISVGRAPTLTCNHEAPIALYAVHGTQDPCVSETTAFCLGRNNGGENVIAFTTKDFGGDATADLSPTLWSMGHCGSHANGGGQVGVAYAFQQNSRDEVRLLGGDGQISGSLCAEPGTRGTTTFVAVLPFDTTQVTSPSNYSSPNYGDPCHPLAAGAHPPAVCVTGDITHTLKAEGFDASEDGTGRGQPIVPCGFQSSQSGVRINHTAGTLDANYGSRRHNGVLHEMAVRRLMPVECERLQGFPDNWTLVPTGKGDKSAADGPRYKQCGNSMAVAVMAWIGRRIAAHLQGVGHNGGPPLDDDFDLLMGDEFEALL